MSGWVKLHRKIKDNPLWTCEPFTRGQAWIDLIILASHKSEFFYKRGVKISLLRGQLGVSEVGLSDRWQWSRTKVRKFLKDLEKEQQIRLQKSNVTQVITIINYDEYQNKEQQTEQQKYSKRTAEVQQKDTFKNVKNNKEDKEEKKTHNAREEIDNPLIEKTAKEVLAYFGFSEMKDFPKLRESVQAMNVLNSNDRLNRFIEQFLAYQEYKTLTRERTHGFKAYLGSIEQNFEDGGWNAANWEDKLEKEKLKNDPRGKPVQAVEEIYGKKF